MFFICIQVPFMHNFFKIFLEYIFQIFMGKDADFMGIPFSHSINLSRNKFNSIINLNIDNLIVASESSNNNREITLGNKEELRPSLEDMVTKLTGRVPGIISDIEAKNNLRENMNIDPKLLDATYTTSLEMAKFERMRASLEIISEKNLSREDPILDHPIRNIHYKPMSLPVDHVMNMQLDPNWFKDPKLEIKLSNFGNMDIARYNPIAFWPGCVNNNLLQGSLYPIVPLLSLKTEFRSSDQLNYAMVYYAHVNILNKEKIMQDNKYLAMNYDIFKNHYVEIYNEIRKRQFLVSKFMSSSFQEELRALSKLEQDKKMAELWHYYAIDNNWEELRRKYGKKLYSNYSYFQSDPNNKWIYKDPLDKSWEQYRGLGMHKNQNFYNYPMFWYTWKDPSK
uniref:Uncharacterized protein n=1 Tax=Clonostachys rogersoniana TaxID=122658 RepID=A0A8F1Y2G8_CLORO|nr:hypothetical protein [Clonostachys rogersoniana]